MGTKRSAFTMIELLFVIVILGIVGGFALEAIRNYYEGIYRTGEYTKRVAQADHILEQLSKYFENAISVSIVNLDREGSPEDCYGVPGVDTDLSHDYTVAFVAVDTDSLRGLWNSTEARYQPGWSEDVFVQEYNITAMDANYSYAETIIDELGSGFDLANSAIYNTDSSDINACKRFNWDGDGETAGFHTISGWSGPTLTLNTLPSHGKRKYLLRTAYAFRVHQDGNFTMYSNFRPWKTGGATERYNTYANRKENLLGQNVAHFYADYNATDFQNNLDLNDRGLVWRLKVCMRGLDANLSDTDYEGNMICRERRVHVRY